MLTLTYASETLVWNEGQRSRIQAVERSYLRGACSLSRMDGETNESIYGRLGMSVKGPVSRVYLKKIVFCEKIP